MRPEPASTSSIQHWTIIGLRDPTQQYALRRAAQRIGADFLGIPALRLRPAADAALARTELAAALACPVCLFTSPAAVRFAASLLPLDGPICIAIGPTTAARLRRAGARQILSPTDDPRSEGALALPALSPPPSQVGLVTAPGGRGVLSQTLNERGSRIVRANVYGREQTAPTAMARRRLLAASGPLAVLISSGEALDGVLGSLAPNERARLQSAVAVCASPRLAQLAQQLGFQQRCISASTQPAAQLQALAACVKEKGFR